MDDTTTAQAATPSAPAAQEPEPKTTEQQPTAAPEAGSLDALPSWAQREIAGLRREAAAARKAKQDAAEAAQAAEEQRLQQERRFEELATQRQQRIAELEPIAERYNALAAKLSADLENEIAKLPAEVQAMRPATADLDDLIDWAEKAKSLAAKMTAAQAAGAGPLPRPANGATRPASNQAAQIAQMRAKF